MRKQPQKLPLEKIYNTLPPDTRSNKKLLNFHDDIGVVIGINGIIFRQLGLALSPFLLEDYRMGMVIRGHMHGFINLREHTLKAGTLVFVTPGTIVEPIDVSDDFLLEGVGLSADRFLLAHSGQLPELFCGRILDGRKVLTNNEQTMLTRMLTLFHEIMGTDGININTIYSMVTTITYYVNQLFADPTEETYPTHAKDLFNRFLRLVNLYGEREHQLQFYADRLCITSRYLGTVIQATSGVRAKEWIDHAVITKAKVMLRHSDKQTSQIADELNFPNISFFCKYFKRLTGLSPQAYRKEGERT